MTSPTATAWPAGGRRCRDERGLVVTAVVLMAIVGFTAVAVAVVAPLGQATDEASQAENAADAAALAGATGVRKALLAALPGWRFDDLDDLGRSAGCTVGRPGAADFAARNAARLTSYCYEARSGRVEVEVEMVATGVEGAPARAEAAASLGLDLSSCSRRDDPVVTTTTVAVVPPPTSTGPAAPSPTYPAGTELRCGANVLRFAVEPDGRLRLVPPGRLAALLVPRLVP